MKITADTNVLARAFLEDHPEQSNAAQPHLRRAEIVALPLTTLCELVWVLRSYKIGLADIAATIQDLINGANVVVSRPAAEAGLTMLNAGGDLADGVIAMKAIGLGRLLRFLRSRSRQAAGEPRQIRALIGLKPDERRLIHRFQFKSTGLLDPREHENKR